MSGISGIGSLGSVGSSSVVSNNLTTAAPTEVASPSTFVSLGKTPSSNVSGIGLYDSIKSLETGFNINIISENTGLSTMVVDNFIKQLLSDGKDSKELNDSMIILLLLEMLKNERLNTIMNM